MRDLAPCGTASAAKRHRTNGEPLDQACIDAYATQQRADRIRLGHVDEIHVPVQTLKALAVSHPHAYDELSHGLGPDIAAAIVRAPRGGRR